MILTSEIFMTYPLAETVRVGS